MESTRARSLRRLILVVDAVLVVAAMLLAFGLHHALRPVIGALKEPPAFEHYAALAYGALPLWLGLVGFFGLHRVLEQPWTRMHLIWLLVKLHAVGRERERHVNLSERAQGGRQTRRRIACRAG